MKNQTKNTIVTNEETTGNQPGTLAHSKSKMWWLGLASLALGYTLYKGFSRLVGILLISPYLRKDEKKLQQFEQNNKDPDPLFEANDKVILFNLKPKDSFAKTWFNNWFVYFTSEYAVPRAMKNLSEKVLPDKLLKKYVNYDHFLVEIKKGLKELQVKYGDDVLNKVYFRSLESLNLATRIQFFSDLKTEFNIDFEANTRCTFLKLKTPYAELDTIELTHPEVNNTPMADRTFMVVPTPRGINYVALLKQHLVYAEQIPGLTVRSFNYRGTGLSTGVFFTQNDLRDDTMNQVMDLINKGADPKRIILAGECIGANVATASAAALHAQGYPVKLFNERSFRSTHLLMFGHLKESPRFIDQVKWNASRVLKPFLTLLAWDLDVDRAFLSLPIADRDFIAVRSKKMNHATYKDDSVIHHPTASIYSLVKEQFKPIEQKLKKGACLSENEIAFLTQSMGGKSSLLHDALSNPNPDELNNNLAAIKEAVLKSHRFCVKANEKPDTLDGHSCAQRKLEEVYPQNRNQPLDARGYQFNALFSLVGKKRDGAISSAGLSEQDDSSDELECTL